MNLYVPMIKKKLGLSANIKRIWNIRAKEFEEQHWNKRENYTAEPFLDERRQEEILFPELKKLNLNGKSFTELGCGYGKFIMLARKCFPDSRFTGYDFSIEMIKLAKENLKGLWAAYAICEDITKMKFPTTDIIFSQDCLDHLNKRQMAGLAPKLIKAAKEYIILVERYSFNYYAHPNNYVFWHNYPELFKEMELQTFKRIEIRQEHHLMIFKKGDGINE